MALALRQAARIGARELREMHAERQRFLAGLKPDSTAWTFAYDQA